MFLSHEKSPSKMKFQKPNILARSKAPPKSKVSKAAASVCVSSPVPAPLIRSVPTKHKCGKPAHFIIKPMQRTKQDSFILKDSDLLKPRSVENKQSSVSDTVRSLLTQINNNDNNDFISIQSSSGFNFEDLQTLHIEDMTKDYQDYAPAEWCYVSINDSEVERDSKSHVQVRIVTQAPSADDDSGPYHTLVLSEVAQLEPDSSKQLDNPSVLKLLPFNGTATFMCDAPDCNKGFPSQQKLNKHKSTHNKTGSRKNAKKIIECPAKKLCPDSWLGPDKRTCGLQFNSRAELLKHLKAEHTLDDAAYSCADCCRPFFWALGVRNHARACLARGRARRLACQWPGCGRVFQQPCRLKEHLRAHTGDRPYPCRHPNCTWSFRTASKLLRHARRHTDDRRHRCGHCGRAFLRAEHLRKHAAAHGCPPPQTEPNAVDTSVMSLQEQSPEDTDESSLPATTEPIISTLSMDESTAGKPDSEWSDGEDLFLSPTEMRDGDGDVESGGGGGGGGGGGAERAARTHCTWPLPPRPLALTALTAVICPDHADYRAQAGLADHADHHAQAGLADHQTHADLADHTDSQTHVGLADHDPDVDAHTKPDEAIYEVELFEGSESKIYTIRSDLFLHGNVIHNEDSESGVAVTAQVVEEASNGPTLQGTPLDADLSLLDGTTIDLMQEELMYTEVAVDGSSFQF